MQMGLADLSDSSESDLTEKQMRFVHEFLLDLNATQAAIRAGYSEKGASVAGSRLLANAKVKKVMDEARIAHARRTLVDTEYVVRELVFLYERTWQAGKWAVAKGCLDLLGRHAGTYIDRQIVMQSERYDAMSHSELKSAEERTEQQFIDHLKSNTGLMDWIKGALKVATENSATDTTEPDEGATTDKSPAHREHANTPYTKRVDR